MKGKIKLGETYETTIGDFTPVEYQKGKLKYQGRKQPNLWSDKNQRLEGRYVDADGNRLRRKYFNNLKSK